MKRSIKSLIGFTMGATDGEIGKVKEFYFDDETWTIRYLVVDTGTWLSGRVVLISPEALLSPDWVNKTFPVNLTKDQIKNSPDINTEVPVSRQEEIKLRTYYPWVAYWGSGYYGIGPTTDLEQEALRQNDGNEDRHLRSTHKVTGYSIKANDGEIGDVEDFLVDEDSWKIDFMLVDIGHWFSGKKVLLSPDLIKEINWETALVIVETTVARVKNSPEYDPDQELTEVYTLAPHNHYNIHFQE
jgi:uncharacterized protein YrrD